MIQPSRRDFLKTVGAGAALAATGCLTTGQAQQQKPNIVYILADDLGYGELGCYGQEKIHTPNLDRLAAEGVRFTQHYSGSAVCAPTRCMLLTGKHSGHAYIRANDEMGDRGDVWNDPALEGQRPLLAGTETLGTLLGRAGYRTGCVGKWGLGWTGSSGDPIQQGFDYYFGVNCQRVAHNYYPTHLWENDRKVPLDNAPFKAHQRFPKEGDAGDPAAFKPYQGREYATDRMLDAALGFLKRNRDQPFFLYFASPVPHVALQVPDDSLAEYRDAFPETPYLGGKGYLPHPKPRAAYAAMITRLDRDIGRLVQRLEELGMRENTLILFSSDNGPTYAGGVDHEFFHSAGPLRGLKGSLLEGGIRVPLLGNWPGHIPAGRTSDHPSAQWDLMATLAEVAGLPAPADTDGISFLPTLLGTGKQQQHDHLYWEYNKQQAVRMGDWKGYRKNIKKSPDAPIQLFNLKTDLHEDHDVAKEHPEIVKKIVARMNAREQSVFDKWNFPEAPGPSE